MSKAQAIILLLLFAFPGVNGQKSVVVSGVVRDTTGETLSKATIRLRSASDTLTIISGEGGAFVFNIRRVPDFELLVTINGHKSFQKSFSIDLGRNSFFLPPIVLAPEYAALVPVIVLGIKPITIKEDTVEYRAEDYALRAGDELERLMKRLPGIDWDTGGNILVDGRKINRIMINGQDYIGGDIKNALKNLPADIVDKVQVIDDYGDKARLTKVKSGSSEKVLNMILKKDKRTGAIAKIETGEGNEGKYTGELYSHAFNGDRQIALHSLTDNNSPIGDHYQNLIYLGSNDKLNPKLSFFGDISISKDIISSTGSMVQDNYFTDSEIHQEQITQSRNDYNASSSSFTMKYAPNSTSNFRFYSYLRSFNDHQSVSSNFQALEVDSGFVKSTIGNSVNISQSHRLLSLSNLYFDKAYPHSNNRMSFAASYQYSGDETNQNNQNNSTTRSNILNSSYFQHDLVNIRMFKRELTSSLNYYISLGKLSLLELGYSFDYLSTQNRQVTRVPDSIQVGLEQIDSLSTYFTFGLLIQRVHVGYLTHFGKMNITLDLDAQPGSQNGQISDKGDQLYYHFFNFLPFAQLSYTLSPERKLNFEYQGTATPPTLQQLNPSEDRSNPQYPIKGNPGLKPSVSQSADLHYEQSSLQPHQYKGFGLGISYQAVQDVIISNLVHPRDTSSVVERTLYANANGFDVIKADYHFNLPPFLHKHVGILINGLVSSSRTPVMTDYILYSTRTFAWTEGIQIKLNIADGIESKLSGSYSHSLTRYSSRGSIPITSSQLTWQYNSRYELIKKWILQYDLSQIFTSGLDGTFRATPIIMNASIGRDLFRRNQARISFSASNLLNGNSGIAQTITPTSITETRTNMSSSYYLFRISVKLEKFR